jgi:predicted nucleic acid-binding protein
MGAILLDTTVLIDLLRGRPGAARRLRAVREGGDRVHTSAINVEETVRGLRPAEDGPARRLFAGVRIVPLGVTEGWQAGEWRRTYAAGGRTLSQADCLIAAAALHAGARLATGNPKHFPMHGVEIEHWPAGA